MVLGHVLMFRVKDFTDVAENRYELNLMQFVFEDKD